MEHLLFAGYLILCAWLVIKVPYFKSSGLTPAQLVIVFLLKVLAGIFYGWIGVYYGTFAQMQDTWAYHYEGLKEYHLLLTSPKLFFTSLFVNQYGGGYQNFLSSYNSWWNDLHVNFFVKIIALFDVFSFGHYYINVIFYSFLSLTGPVAVFKMMNDAFPQKKRIVFGSTFLIPSFLYWTSGLHRDGIVFAGLALIISEFYFALKRRRFSISALLLMALGFLLLLALKNYLIITLVPALIAWSLAHKFHKRPLLTFLGIYALFITLFFTARHIVPKIDFPDAVVTKQADFKLLQGRSAVPTFRLEPTFSSFILHAPAAIGLSLLRPYPTDVKDLLSMAAAVETGGIVLLFLIFLFFRVKENMLTPFFLFCFFFSISVLLTIGYTVNFLGAIVRYRSIVLPFLLIPFMAKINWCKIGSWIGIGNKYNTSSTL